jgi:hypothetical protein
MAKKNVHVVPSGNRWAVKPEGAEKPLSTHRTQELATDQEQIVSENPKDPPVNITQPTLTAVLSTVLVMSPLHLPSR